MSKLNEAAAEKQSRSFWTRQQTFEELLRLLDLRQHEGYASPAVMVAENAEAYLKARYRSPVTGRCFPSRSTFIKIAQDNPDFYKRGRNGRQALA
ncbi:putative AraC family transcriptional regulator [Paenibacillus agaridevorans]|uniref:Putative AraC family transcriptional regulator n=1 Tax=Paenibacillus agaridevorans TaxID=171404 RepID=A0A2R5EJU8_9BACL|nr:putative AraC family transcriptional regulator [Paenibacillus agaridevorans]